MKIYIVKGDNCEEYPEDYQWWIEKDVYLLKENAEKRLKELEEKASKDYKKNRWDKKEYEIEEYNIKDYMEVM